MKTRTDHNQAAIVNTFRKAGCLVVDLHEVGGGCPDLLICTRGKVALVEVKSKRGTFTPAQIEFHQAGWPVKVVRSCMDAVELVNRMMI